MVSTSVEYQGQLTVDDVIAGQRAVARRAHKPLLDEISPWVFWILLCVMLALADGWLRAVPLALGAWVFVLDVINKRRASESTRRYFHSHPALQCRFHSRFDDEGFWTRGELFEDRRSWEALRAWEETADHIIVYESELGFGRIIPKRLFTDPVDLDSLRTILDAHLPKAGMWSNRWAL